MVTLQDRFFVVSVRPVQWVTAKHIFTFTENINTIIGLEETQKKSAALGIITAEVSESTGYGRIIRAGDTIAKIVEQADASEEEQKIREVNSGMYCFNKKFLLENIENLDDNNNQNEIYLTDLIEIAFQNKLETVIVKVSEDTIKGVNSMSQLNDVEKTLREKLIKSHMENGVYFQDTTTADSVILWGTSLSTN